MPSEGKKEKKRMKQNKRLKLEIKRSFLFDQSQASECWTSPTWQTWLRPTRWVTSPTWLTFTPPAGARPTTAAPWMAQGLPPWGPSCEASMRLITAFYYYQTHPCAFHCLDDHSMDTQLSQEATGDHHSLSTLTASTLPGTKISALVSSLQRRSLKWI